MYKSRLALVTFLFILLLLVIASACKEKYPEEKMTADQVINIVYVYGVPTFPLGESPRPSGQWGAVYQGESEWRIQGTVVAQKKLTTSELIARGLLKRSLIEGPQYETEYYQTTWSYANSKLKLIKYQQ